MTMDKSAIKAELHSLLQYERELERMETRLLMGDRVEMYATDVEQELTSTRRRIAVLRNALRCG